MGRRPHVVQSTNAIHRDDVFRTPSGSPSNVSIVPTFTSTARRTIPPAALVLCITGPRSSQFSKSTSTDPWSALSRALHAFSTNPVGRCQPYLLYILVVVIVAYLVYAW